MITYEPLFETLRVKGITQYDLVNKYGIYKNTIHRIKHGKPITTKTLDALCFILDCEVGDILKHDKTQ